MMSKEFTGEYYKDRDIKLSDMIKAVYDIQLQGMANILLYLKRKHTPYTVKEYRKIYNDLVSWMILFTEEFYPHNSWTIVHNKIGVLNPFIFFMMQYLDEYCIDLDDDKMYNLKFYIKEGELRKALLILADNLDDFEWMFLDPHIETAFVKSADYPDVSSKKVEILNKQNLEKIIDHQISCYIPPAKPTIISPLSTKEIKKIMEEDNMENENSINININLEVEDIEEKEENIEEKYDNEIDIKLSDIIKEKHGEELKNLARIKQYQVGQTDGAYDPKDYYFLIELVLRRIKERCEIENTTNGLNEYINRTDEYMMIARYNVISSLISSPYSMNENLHKFIKVNLEELCDKIKEGHADKVEASFFMIS